MAAAEPGGYHTRLTHSLAVARIGRRLAFALLATPVGARHAGPSLDPAVVEVACLAHDLGHPPFAHVAEAELDRLLVASGVTDGFEANAQAFRVVCTLPDDGAGHRGLNLTRATLAAILKYPWQRGGSADQPRKWGAYASEATDLAWARVHLPADDCQPTLEAQIMDWADLVAYATLDFEDFVRAGSLPLAQLAHDPAERARFLALVFARRRIAQEQGLYESSLDQLLRDCPATATSPTTRAGRTALRCYINHQIDRAIGGVSLTPDASSVTIDPTAKASILLLEGLTWHYVIDSDLLVPQRDAQRQIIRSLFEALAQAASSGCGLPVFPSTAQDRLQTTDSQAARMRVVVDVIASLTEDQALQRSIL
jgi:dGTPase